MEYRSKDIWFRKTAAVVVLPFAALGLAGCGGEEEAAYDQAFVEEMDSYISETVTLSAKVNDDITPKFFSIAGTEDSEVEPLLVMHGEDTMDVQDGLTVEVTGMVQEAFDVQAVEENMGVDLNESALENWNGDPYLEATEISVLDDN